MKAMTAEIFGRASGLSHGKGGHMHLFDPVNTLPARELSLRDYLLQLVRLWRFAEKNRQCYRWRRR